MFDSNQPVEQPQNVTPAPSTAGPNLAVQLEHLMLTAPLQQVELNKNARARSLDDKNLFDRVDMRYLAVAALEKIVDHMAIGSGILEKDLVAYLRELVRVQAPDAWDNDQETVATAILDGLRNGGRSFSGSFFNGTKTVPHDFRLILTATNPNGELVFKLTDKAIALIIHALRVSAPDHQAILELMLKESIQKGLLGQAEEQARAALRNSIRFQEQINDMLEAARRRVGSISWVRDIQPLCDQALDHIVSTIERERVLLDQIERKRMDMGNTESVATLDRLHATIENCQSRHSRLRKTIHEAGEKWRNTQISAFRSRTARRLPDLDADILPRLLEIPLEAVADAANDITTALNPPLIHSVFDFGGILAMLAEPPAERPAEREAEMGPERELPPPPKRYPEGMRAAVLAWLEAHVGKIPTMAGLIEEAAKDGKPIEFQELVFYLLEQAIQPKLLPTLPQSTDLTGTFEASFVSGDDITYSKEAP